MADRIRVALIGAGRIGRMHARVLAFQIPGCELVVVADTVEAAARSAAEEVRVGRWTTDVDAVMADPTIRAVVVASSTETHAPLIIAAAQAGKDVFCEKPIALDLETTDAAIDAVGRAGVRLQVGFQRRFDKGYRKAKEMIDAGQLGRIEMIRDAMRDPRPASREYLAGSGGLYRDMTIHNFDCVRWLMGSEPTEIFAMAAALVDPMIEELNDVDTSIVSLRFAHGGLAVIDNSRRAGFGYDVRTEIFGSESAVFVGFSRDTPILHLTPDGVASDHVHFFIERFFDAYVDELKEFVASVVEGRETAVSGADGRAALAMAYAAEASRREGTPVRLDRFDRRADL
jgi:myo-inositol 2-dehydrogenase / D-chiro-inositol 1-dehydrogenase